MSDGFVVVFFAGTATGLEVGAVGCGMLARGGCFAVAAGVEDALARVGTTAPPPASAVQVDSTTVAAGATGAGDMGRAGAALGSIRADAAGAFAPAVRSTPLVSRTRISADESDKPECKGHGQSAKGYDSLDLALDTRQRAVLLPDKAPPPAEPASEALDSPPPPPMTEVPGDLPQEAPRRPSRDPSFVIVLLAIVLGIAGVAVLFALFLW